METIPASDNLQTRLPDGVVVPLVDFVPGSALERRLADIVFHFGLPNDITSDVPDELAYDNSGRTSTVVDPGDVVDPGEVVEPYPTSPEELLTPTLTARSTVTDTENDFAEIFHHLDGSQGILESSPKQDHESDFLGFHMSPVSFPGRKSHPAIIGHPGPARDESPFGRRAGVLLHDSLGRKPGEMTMSRNFVYFVYMCIDENMNEIFKMIPDTGSNTTWALGDNYMLMPMQAQDNDGSTEAMADSTVGAPSHETLRRTQEFYPRGRNKTLHKNTFYTDITYADKTTVLLALGPEFKFQIPRMVEFTRDGGVTACPIQALYKFGIAYCISRKQHFREGDGIIGLGCFNSQKAFSDLGVLQAPSFLRSIRTQLSPVPDEFGTVLYWFCNPIDETGDPTGSWFSINALPPDLHDMHWSCAIPVTPEGARSGKYIITLIRFEIGGTVKDDNGDITFVPQESLDFTEKPQFLLDTGSSVSYARPDLIRFLRTKVFKTKENKAIDEAFGDASAAKSQAVEYSVPLEKFEHLSCVNMVFRGFNDREVKVYLPARGFLYEVDMTSLRAEDKKVAEGLFFVDPLPEGAKQCTLGTNLFQYAAVAMHHPEASIERKENAPLTPYVRLSGVFPREQRNRRY